MHSNIDKIIEQIHKDCFRICYLALGKYLEIAGNVGIFCQSEQEYGEFVSSKNELTEPSDNPNQKYFKLRKNIIIPRANDIPETIYTHLYIRKPDPTPYGLYRGDIDFVLDLIKYLEFKKTIKQVVGAQIYDRPGWDTIQITNPQIKSVAYVSTKEFAEKVRVKFD